MADRLRLSQKARAKLLTLATQSDTDPIFLLEYLINRFGSQALRELTNSEPIPPPTAQPIPVTPVSDTNEHYPALTDTNGSPNAGNSPIDAFLSMEL